VRPSNVGHFTNSGFAKIAARNVTGFAFGPTFDDLRSRVDRENVARRVRCRYGQGEGTIVMIPGKCGDLCHREDR
jgi:hypothetical protein